MTSRGLKIDCTRYQDGGYITCGRDITPDFRVIRMCHVLLENDDDDDKCVVFRAPSAYVTDVGDYLTAGAFTHFSNAIAAKQSKVNCYHLRL